MLGQNDKLLPQDTVFGDFEIVGYADADGRSEMTDFFLDLWRDKGGDQKSIKRADFSPIELKKYLEHVVLMDVIRDRGSWSLTVRLIGGHVANYYGEITGKDVREMNNSKAIERIYYVSRRVIERKEPAMTVSPAFSPERLFMEALALYMPLFDEQNTVEKIMVAVHVSSPNQP